MHRIRTSFVARLAAVALLAGAWLGFGPLQAADAADRVVLKDGRVFEGEIVREAAGAVWIKVTVSGIERTEFFGPADIASVERSPDAPAVASTEAARAPDAPAKSSPRTPGVKRAAVLTLEGMVGTQFSHKPLKEAIPMLEEEGVDVVVFKINSGGGLLYELSFLQDVIHDEYKPKFHVVAWIESAISAAAMTAHVIEEIYFMPQGNYGACTGYSGALVAMKDRGLEEVLYMMEMVSAKGQHHPAIMRSMQIDDPLSCTIKPNGDVEWYNTEEGDFLVNPAGRILTFDAGQAIRFKFAKGQAATIEELGRQLGYAELEWVGETVPGVPFPVSKAEKHQREWRKSMGEAESNLQSNFAKYQISIANAQAAQDDRERGAFVGKAARELAIMEAAFKKHPILGLFTGIDEQWFEDQKELLRRLRRR